MKSLSFFKVALLALVTLLFLATTSKSVYAMTKKDGIVTVSYYGNGDHRECGKNRPCQGARTACGEVFRMERVSVANKTLPCGTRVRFCHEGTCIVARVNDRGPFIKGRTFDLSVAAAHRLGIIEQGVAKVHATVLD